MHPPSSQPKPPPTPQPARAPQSVSASWPCSSMSFTEELTSTSKGTKGIIAVIGHSNSLNGMKMMKGRVFF